MAREILFKAKKIDNGEWVEGYPHLNRDGWIMWLKGIGVADYIDENTLCQFTGLTDCNGNKIWENDVVRGSHWTEREEFHNWKVDWNEKSGLIVFKDSTTSKAKLSIHDFYDFGEVEVIGNIFDNKELLGRRQTVNNIGREEFKEIVKPVVEWMHKNSTPHDTIIIRQDGAELVCGEMAIPFEVPD